jgi:hypothetical protein
LLKLRGSLLLEIAVALSIIGLISGFFITKTILTGKIMREQTTKNNIMTVTVALAAFVANNYRLPRPSTDGNGRENSESDMTCVGKIPYRTLGISAKNTVDGNGRPLIYIVEILLTLKSEQIYDSAVNMARCFCEGIFDPKISVDKIDDTDTESPIAFVIDTEDNPPTISGKICVTASKNTFWISRDMLLMQYLKNSPCNRENIHAFPTGAIGAASTSGGSQADPFDMF